MATIENLSKIADYLKKHRARGTNSTVVVGYTQAYAVHVHENLQSHHPVGQAKFLEQPAREMSKELQKVVADSIKSGLTMEDGLLRAGLRLQRESQKLVPVDTGALRASGFTARLSEMETASTAAYSKGEAKRVKTQIKRVKKTKK